MHPDLKFEKVEVKTNEEEYQPTPEEIAEWSKETCDLLYLGKLAKYKQLGILNLDRFKKMLADGWHPMDLSVVNENGWFALSQCDVFPKDDIVDIAESTIYDCPFGLSDKPNHARYFYGSVPVILLKRKPFFETNERLPNEDYKTSLKRMASDIEWHGIERFLNIDPITVALNGHGYSSWTLPSDGSGNWALLCLEIDSETILVVRTWDWYNK